MQPSSLRLRHQTSKAGCRHLKARRLRPIVHLAMYDALHESILVGSRSQEDKDLEKGGGSLESVSLLRSSKCLFSPQLGFGVAPETSIGPPHMAMVCHGLAARLASLLASALASAFASASERQKASSRRAGCLLQPLRGSG